MRHLSRRPVPRAPRLHLRLATAAFGLSGLGAALLTAPPQQATVAHAPFVILTDLRHARPGPDIATAPNP